MSQRPATPRVIRGFSAALAATFAALVAHVAAGGAAPELGSLAAPLGLSMLASVLLQSRKLSIARLTGAVLVSQLLFHVLFVMGAGGAHAHGAAHMLPGNALLGDALLGDALMWGSHAIAAIATVVFLVRGERAILGMRDVAEHLVAWLHIRLTGPILVAALPAPVRVRIDAERAWLRLSQTHGSTQPHRGPPTLN